MICSYEWNEIKISDIGQNRYMIFFMFIIELISDITKIPKKCIYQGKCLLSTFQEYYYCKGTGFFQNKFKNVRRSIKRKLSAGPEKRTSTNQPTPAKKPQFEVLQLDQGTSDKVG